MDIEQRFERLERENQRLKLAGAAVVAVLLAVALVGAVKPQEIPEIIKARAFRVMDENDADCWEEEGDGPVQNFFAEFSAAHGDEELLPLKLVAEPAAHPEDVETKPNYYQNKFSGLQGLYHSWANKFYLCVYI